MSTNPAVRQVAPLLLPTGWNVIYTYTGTKNGYATVGFLSLCSATGVADMYVLAVRPSGAVVGTSHYIINASQINANQTHLLVSDSEDTGLGNLTLKDGDSLMIYAVGNNLIACRCTMVEHNQA